MLLKAEFGSLDGGSLLVCNFYREKLKQASCLVFISHTIKMSAKKSPSNIRPEDRDEFKRKLQAVHQEMATRDVMVMRWAFGERNTGFPPPVEFQAFRGPRLKKEYLCRSVLLDGTETYIGGSHPDSTQTIIFWDWEKPRRRWEQVWGAGARKWIQEYYTDGKDRGIGEIKA